MDADEALAVLPDEGQQRGLLLVVHVELAAGEEDDRVEVIEILRVAIQVLLGDELRVAPQICVPEAALPAQFPQDPHGIGDGVMLKALDGADHQQLFLRRLADRERRTHHANDYCGKQGLPGTLHG